MGDVIDLSRYLNPITPEVRRDIRRGTKFCSECKRRMWLHSETDYATCIKAAALRVEGKESRDGDG